MIVNPDNLTFRTQYWDDDPSKIAFLQFIQKIHGLDFTLWNDLGFWDEDYTPFSYFLDGEVISSVCIYKLKAIVQGQSAQMIQISGVGTHRAWRNMGLNRKLTKAGLKWAGEDPVGLYLFADEDAIPYYLKTGFTPQKEYYSSCSIQQTKVKKGLVKLELGDPKVIQQVYGAAQNREAVSHLLSIESPRLLMFHALYTLGECAYYVKDLDCIVFFRRKEGCLYVYDIVASRVPPWGELLPYLYQAGDKEACFFFFTDKLDLNSEKIRTLRGNNFFTRGQFPLDPVIFPYTSRA